MSYNNNTNFKNFDMDNNTKRKNNLFNATNAYSFNLDRINKSNLNNEEKIRKVSCNHVKLTNNKLKR